jgi:hypothetical protein
MSAQGVYPDSNEFNGEDMQPELGDFIMMLIRVICRIFRITMN